jgi:hypothetical protein
MSDLANHFEAFDASEYTTKSRPPSADVVIGVNADGSPKTARHPGAFTSTKPTPFERDGGEAVAEKFAGGEDGLYNDRNPHYLIKRQKPEHRIVILLKAQGNSNKEIAKITEMSPVAIANILKQPWARKQLLDEINAAGRNEVIQIFKGAAMDVASAVVDIVNDPEAKASDKISASHLILDRLFGKATQPMDINLDGSKLKTMSDAELLKIATGTNN